MWCQSQGLHNFLPSSSKEVELWSSHFVSCLKKSPLHRDSIVSVGLLQPRSKETKPDGIAASSIRDDSCLLTQLRLQGICYIEVK